MDKPSFTETYQTGYVAGAACGGLLAFGLFMTFVTDSAVDPLMLWIMTAALGLLTAFFFLLGASSQTWDEHGIRIKTPLFTKQFAWSDVKFVELRADRGRNGGGVPLLTMDINGWIPGWPVSYTRRIMACIRCYYGEPNIDTWGKPPEYV